MIASLSGIAFLYPWMLAALALLPVIWFLLRVMPPAPRRIVFPATRFLSGLIPERTTPSTTPWWILLLRCLIVLLTILALAQPVLNPSAPVSSQSALRIVMDTGWAAAQTWESQVKAAEDILSKAQREGTSLYILPTTLEASGAPRSQGPMTAAQALSVIRGLAPDPFAADYAALAAALDTDKGGDSVHSIWLGHGLNEGGFDRLAATLQRQGGLYYLSPEKAALPVLLRVNNAGAGADLSFSLLQAGDEKTRLPVTLHALSETGQILEYKTFAENETGGALSFPLRDEIRNQTARVELAGRRGAGAVFLIDENLRRRSVGLLSSGGEDQSKPLVDALYYLSRALEPFSALSIGAAAELIAGDVSVLILPDTGALPPATLSALEGWVKKGGVLLRFAGPEMAASDSFLTPVNLLKGERALEGDLTWEKPRVIAPFDEKSPLFGVALREDITVRRQVLAHPGENIDGKVWATLDDGTPIITASRLEKGLLVLVHTTATPDWSDLALSGAYIDILRKIINLSSGTADNEASNTTLSPLSVMDGFGAMKDPKGVSGIPAQDFAITVPSALHPPGLYGYEGAARALNLSDHISQLNAVDALPSGVERHYYSATYERNLKPALLTAALLLLLADWAVMAFLLSGLRLPARGIAASFLFLSLAFYGANAAAQGADLSYAGQMYMAFIKSGDAQVDQTAREGLDALARVLAARTSVEPKGTVALDPETDTLVFFPLIYWPVAASPLPLSEDALNNIQHYLDHGGTILFDTRDQGYSLQGREGAGGGLSATANARALQSMIGGLSIPALTPAPDDHVLRRSFYLLKDFPGRYADGVLWVEQQSVAGRDGVSSVLIGGNDWAAAWAARPSSGGVRPYLSGGSRQQELAFRFGVNVMMYALTGNYKADQVHLPFILERLDQ